MVILIECNIEYLFLNNNLNIEINYYITFKYTTIELLFLLILIHI